MSANTGRTPQAWVDGPLREFMGGEAFRVRTGNFHRDVYVGPLLNWRLRRAIRIVERQQRRRDRRVARVEST